MTEEYLGAVIRRDMVIEVWHITQTIGDLTIRRIERRGPITRKEFDRRERHRRWALYRRMERTRAHIG